MKLLRLLLKNCPLLVSPMLFTRMFNVFTKTRKIYEYLDKLLQITGDRENNQSNFPTEVKVKNKKTVLRESQLLDNVVRCSVFVRLSIYLFGVLRRFQHCTGHITTCSCKGRGNQYIESRIVYCKLPTNGKQLPAFPHKALTGIEPRPQRWEARVLPLCHRGLHQIK